MSPRTTRSACAQPLGAPDGPFFRGDHASMDAEGRVQGVVELTPAGIVRSANARLLERLGYGPEELRGRSLDHPLDPPIVRTVIVRAGLRPDTCDVAQMPR